MNWILHTLRNSFVYTGRARRAEYGWFFLFSLCISISTAVLIWAAETLKLNTLKELVDGLSVIVDYLLWIPSLSLAARRLHDLGRSGWWQLVVAPLVFLELIVWITVGGTSDKHMDQFFEMYPMLTIISGLCVLASLCLVLLLLFRDGEKTANKYGESPKYSDEQETVIQTL